MSPANSQTFTFARRRASALLGVGAALLLSAAIGTPSNEPRDYARYVPVPHVLANPTLWSLLAAGAAIAWLLHSAQFSAAGTTFAFRLSRLQQRCAIWRGPLLINSTIFCLTALAAAGRAILAPELATADASARWLQAAAAIALFWHRGRPFAGVLIALLFAMAAREHGPVPMIGELTFVGVAVYLMFTSWPHAQRVLVLRACTAAALMWLAVEKWIDPDWVGRVAQNHPVVTLGLGGPEALVMAGVIQCSLGFGLLWRGLYATFSAIALACFMSIGILESGLVDLPGQVTLLGVLGYLALDRVPTRMYGRRQGAAHVALSLIVCAVVAILVHFALVYARAG